MKKLGILYVMCGIPGSGKSTWLKENVTDKNAVIISRDEVRFSLLKEGDDYFSKEKETFEEFVRLINKNLKLGYDVYADATHINSSSRKKLLSQIPKESGKAALVMETPSSVCLERNAEREGRRRVPDSAIRRMSSQFEYPTYDEGFDAIGSLKWNWKVE